MRVLIVDDDEDTVEIFSEFLRLWGHDARIVKEPSSVVSEALDFRPEIILLDISMPVLDGYEIARRLRQHDALQEVFLVAVTGHGLQRDIDRAHAAGFDLHLLKPIEIDRLRALVQETPVRAHRQAQSNN